MNPTIFHIANTTVPPAEDGNVVILVVAGACLVVLIVLVLLVNAICTRLARIEKRLAKEPATTAEVLCDAGHAAAHAGDAAGSQIHGDFERFLAEEPKRLLLGKKEQSAAYRAWRKEHGLTWSPPQKDDALDHHSSSSPS